LGVGIEDASALNPIRRWDLTVVTPGFEKIFGEGSETKNLQGHDQTRLGARVISHLTYAPKKRKRIKGPIFLQKL
jgi:hypothetical protein